MFICFYAGIDQFWVICHPQKADNILCRVYGSAAAGLVVKGKIGNRPVRFGKMGKDFRVLQVEKGSLFLNVLKLFADPADLQLQLDEQRQNGSYLLSHYMKDRTAGQFSLMIGIANWPLLQ